jgi:Glycosyltransferase
MMFGTSPRPNNLEDWFIYKQSPNKDEHNYILNSSAIFVGASNIEGWGLPIGEAMQCGCAIACTDNKGYLEMAKDEQTALVSPVGDSNSLAYNILRLINDNDLRHRIAKNGYDFIQQFDINKSYQNLKDFIIKKIDNLFKIKLFYNGK